MMTRYLEIVAKIHDKAKECGRNPDEITLVAVSKNHNLQEVFDLYDAGCRHFGENRVQEALHKIAGAPPDTLWHFIGTLQKNKIGKVLESFWRIHSVDRPELARAISRRTEKQVPVLLQVNTSGEESKHGLSVENWREASGEIFQLPNLNIQGLMTMAPLTDDDEVIRRCFSALREFRDELEQKTGKKLPHLSMGMSRDYLIAVEEGATFIRIGSAIFD